MFDSASKSSVLFSGVAIGTGKQYIIAYVNVISYFVIGVPLAALLGYAFHLDVMVSYRTLKFTLLPTNGSD